MGVVRWAPAVGSLLGAGCLATASLDGLTGGAGSADATAGGVDASEAAGNDVVDAGAAQDGPPADAPPEVAEGESGVEAGGAYMAAVLADQPLGYWRVDEASGSTAHDSSGHKSDAVYIGTMVHGVVGATPDGNGAITLDGTSGAVQAASTFSFTGAAPMSLETWVMPASSTPQYAPVACNQDQGGLKVGYLLWVRVPSVGTTAGFERWVQSAGAPTADKVSTSAAIPGTTWHHLVATYDGSNERLYLDGVLQATTASAVQLAANGSLYFGRSVYEGTFYPGSLDELAVYDHALAGNRVLAHYQATGR